MTRNEFVHEIEIDTRLLMDGLVTANQAMVLEAIRLTTFSLTFVVKGEPYCILNLADVCRVYNLKYINAHNAVKGLLNKGYLEKTEDKLKITEKWYDILALYL